MTTYAIKYAIWTGAVGAVLQYYKKQGRGWQSLLTKGFAQKAVTGLLSSYLQMQNVPLLGTGLDANYMYNGIIGALSSALMKEGKTPPHSCGRTDSLCTHWSPSSSELWSDVRCGSQQSPHNYFA